MQIISFCSVKLKHTCENKTNPRGALQDGILFVSAHSGVQ